MFGQWFLFNVGPSLSAQARACEWFILVLKIYVVEYSLSVKAGISRDGSPGECWLVVDKEGILE